MRAKWGEQIRIRGVRRGFEVIESNGDVLGGKRETGRRESGESRRGQSSRIRANEHFDLNE